MNPMASNSEVLTVKDVVMSGRRAVRPGSDEMRSSVEALKLRRMRVRNEIFFNRSAGGGPERAEDLEALLEELRGLSKQIEETEHK
jgi:hypothetical protein